MRRQGTLVNEVRSELPQEKRDRSLLLPGLGSAWTTMPGPTKGDPSANLLFQKATSSCLHQKVISKLKQSPSQSHIPKMCLSMW